MIATSIGATLSKRMPSPWVAEYERPLGYTINMVGNGPRIAYVAAQPSTADAQKANAAFIVKACNNHDALVAALANLCKAAETFGTGIWPEVAAARAALSKVQS